MIRLLIADDHKIFRDGLISIFNNEGKIKVIGEASNGSQALQILGEIEVDVVLMDINMGENDDGISTTQIIKQKYPNTNVLILSMYNESSYIIKSMEVGASGYLLKNAGREETIRAIQTIYAGDTYYSSEVSDKIMAHITNKNKSSIHLTKREVEILKLIANEYSNSQIAEKLFISIRTVDTHRRNLLEKIAVKNTVGLIKYAIKEGLVHL